MTPSRIGRIAAILAGVLPSISFASEPTATTSFVCVFRATTDGSRKTIPRPSIYTYVLAVPRSIPTFRCPNENATMLPLLCFLLSKNVHTLFYA